MHSHKVADISATGTPSSSTYLRGDGSWNTPAGGYINYNLDGGLSNSTYGGTTAIDGGAS